MIWDFIHSNHCPIRKWNSHPLLGTNKKKVSFDTIVNVVLIPHLKEYKYCGLDLWYNKNDYLRFRQQYYSY